MSHVRVLLLFPALVCAAAPGSAADGEAPAWEGCHEMWSEDVTAKLLLERGDDGITATLDAVTNFVFGCSPDDPPVCRIGTCWRRGRLLPQGEGRAHVVIESVEGEEPCRIELERGERGIVLSMATGCGCTDMGSGVDGTYTPSGGCASSTDTEAAPAPHRTRVRRPGAEP